MPTRRTLRGQGIGEQGIVHGRRELRPCYSAVISFATSGEGYNGNRPRGKTFNRLLMERTEVHRLVLEQKGLLPNGRK